MNAKQLKDSILQYAMQGKLVPQKLSDDSAFVNLSNAMLDRESAIENKKLRNEAIASIDEDEIKDKFPVNWAYARLPFICENVNGAIRRGPFGSSITKSMFIPKGENTFKVFEQGNAIRKTLDYGDYYISEEDFVKLSSFEVREGDILISCAGTIGEAYILPFGAPKGIINQALMKLSINENVMLKEFFLIVFETLVRTINKNAKGSAMKNLASLKYLKNEVVFPIPPLEEQHRIIDRTNAINSKLEIYDQKEKLRVGNLRKFPIQLEKSILQYATQGKLVGQIETDEPATQLIERIKAEKVRLVKEKVIKKEKTLQAIIEEEIPFEIPESWEWVRLGDISSYIQRGKSPKYSDIKEVPVISQKCVQWSGFDIDAARFIEPSTLEKYGEIRFLQNEDILWNSTGLGTVGRVGVYYADEVSYEKVVVDTHVTIIRLPEMLNREFVYYYLASPIIQEAIPEMCSGSTKQKELNLSTIKNVIIPLPPRREQDRIVKKIKELLKVKNLLVKIHN
ncbi:restriction endonuclease subunit S [Bacillus mycoides]|uniref:restriction endonuclease subunit S n=1 Tax=Bacillus mycoides TaxID=1405 RepID=UPI00285357F2|nr:restriction endonuclease subunit S [Bacillus mycoides]MDR4900745.1 restriction endonuclease subunit S [Bacillus mycoides]